MMAGTDPLDEPRPKKEVDAEAEQITNLFIRRPIFAAVISIVIVLLGLFALNKLPIARYPNVTPPVVQVNELPGRYGARRRDDRRRTDRAAARGYSGAALLQVHELG